MTSSNPSIKSYFAGKTIFITGATGFLGKVLTEKLLRSCPDIKCIYALIRSKKDKTPQDRLLEALDNPLFDLLKSENPKQFEKIKAIDGDITRPQLGLTSTDRDTLKNEVHVFFNNAASVRFNDPLKLAIVTNVCSCREAALLALEMKNIEAFLHISTAFCNTNNGLELQEILYPANGDWKEAIRIAENIDDHLLNVLTSKYIGEGYPNTYTYTKHLGEHCINDLLLGKIPLGICRPTIVHTLAGAPLKGWIDNFFGHVGVSFGIAIGLIRILYIKPDAEFQCVAADTVIQGIIVTAWHLANHYDKTEKKSLIVHACKPSNISFPVNLYTEYAKKLIPKMPIRKMMWYPNVCLTSCWYKYFLYFILFQLLPSIMLDFLLKIFGYKPFLKKIQMRFYSMYELMMPFMNPSISWRFNHKNADLIFGLVQDEEKKEFNNDVSNWNEENIIEISKALCNYVRIRLLGEPVTIPKSAYRWHKGRYILDLATKTAFWGFWLWLVLIRWSIHLKIWAAILNYWSGLN